MRCLILFAILSTITCMAIENFSIPYNNNIYDHPMVKFTNRHHLVRRHVPVAEEIVRNAPNEENLFQPLNQFAPNIKNVNQAGIDQCFDDYVDVITKVQNLNGHLDTFLSKHHVSLFEDKVNVSDIVWEYYASFSDHDPTAQNIRSLLKSIRYIIDYVESCSFNFDNNNNLAFSGQNGPSKMGKKDFYKIGFTSLSDYSDEKMENMIGHDSISFTSVMKQKITNTKKSSFLFLKKKDKNNTDKSLTFKNYGDHEKSDSSVKGYGQCQKLTISNYNHPKSFDWRQRSVVTSTVYNQGYKCGSCWAFATAQVVECALVMKNLTNGVSVNDFVLSKQQMVDKDTNSFGCSGGYATSSFEYVKKNGLTSEQNYPYVEIQNKYPKQNYPIVGRIKDYCIRSRWLKDKTRREYLEDIEIEKALIQNGPLYIVLHGESDILRNYKSGILKHYSCPKVTNHAVLLVGYDENSWILKNSWGQFWGNKGYFNLAKGSNMCGINSEIAYVII